MKRITYIIVSLFVCSCCLSSCEKWLEATSSDKIPADKLFNTKDGFKDALSGVYLNMGGYGLYGENATWFGNDLAAYPYVIQSNLSIKDWQSHSYTTSNTKSKIESIWLNGYNIVANINMILRALDERQNVLTEYESTLFKGELLGLRAYIHFDLMRMFGLDNWDGENASKLTIPYVKVYEKEPASQLSYSETAKLLMEDIDNAISLLEEDPARGIVPDNFDSVENADGFWSNRQKRFNYYAAKALKANVLNWEKKHTEAATLAREVVDEALEKGLVSWTDPSSFGQNKQNLAFNNEHIFSLECYVMAAGIEGYLLSAFTASTGGMILTTEDVQQLLYPQVDPETGSPSGAEDIRGTAGLLEFGGVGYLCGKLYKDLSNLNNQSSDMPMLTIAQLLYIEAESKIVDGDSDGALDVLDEVRSHRGIGDALPKTVNAQKELLKEYYRETINEGKMFYVLKHFAITEPLTKTLDVSYEDLIYPYPTDVLNYGMVQEL